MASLTEQDVTIRHDPRPGDLGRVTELHGRLYTVEYGFDHTFEAYVARTLGEFGQTLRPDRDRLWLAERADRLVGSIGIAGREEGAAQLRWFLVDPAVRGRGLGRHLIEESLAFCRKAGFRKTEETPVQALWGTLLAEQRYNLSL